MPTEIKVLARGDITSSSATQIYSPGTGKSALVSGISLFKDGSGNEDVFLYTRLAGGASGTEARFHRWAQAGQNSSSLVTDAVTLNGGEAILGSAASGLGVHYAIFGIER